jgi:hypothetical protein
VCLTAPSFAQHRCERCVRQRRIRSRRAREAECPSSDGRAKEGPAARTSQAFDCSHLAPTACAQPRTPNCLHVSHDPVLFRAQPRLTSAPAHGLLRAIACCSALQSRNASSISSTCLSCHRHEPALLVCMKASESVRRCPPPHQHPCCGSFDVLLCHAVPCTQSTSDSGAGAGVRLKPSNLDAACAPVLYTRLHAIRSTR